MKSFNTELVSIKKRQLNEHLELKNTISKINKLLDGINNSLDRAEVRINECKNRPTQNYIVIYIRSVLWDYNYEILKSFYIL